MNALRRRPDAVLVGFLGLILMGLVGPAALRELALLPHHATMQALAEGGAMPVDRVAELGAAVAWAETFSTSDRLERLSARINKRRFDRPAEVEALRRAARLAPGDSVNWMRLALDLPPGPDAARALRLSALTNALEYDATPRRVDLGLRLWPYMDDGDKQAFGRLVLALWRWQTGRLAMVAARRGGYDQIAPYLKAVSQEDWEHFTRSYAIHRLNPEEPYLHGPP
ncbi:hypothetical protein amb1451 [Paramagnetospirillum magneticum AMB-1]|uniref:Uncharacterized protein n=2 Tax=Paramagnetospirillum magneticum TaxID=84159 RepID=Q2W7C0_PARM1|nr:hypothetical protein amb1451 [Paramagnetospirillum magneticum AMB-1]